MGKMETLEHADAIERGLMDIGGASKASTFRVAGWRKESFQAWRACRFRLTSAASCGA